MVALTEFQTNILIWSKHRIFDKENNNKNLLNRIHCNRSVRPDLTRSPLIQIQIEIDIWLKIELKSNAIKWFFGTFNRISCQQINLFIWKTSTICRFPCYRDAHVWAYPQYHTIKIHYRLWSECAACCSTWLILTLCKQIRPNITGWIYCWMGQLSDFMTCVIKSKKKKKCRAISKKNWWISTNYNYILDMRALRYRRKYTRFMSLTSFPHDTKYAWNVCALDLLLIYTSIS